MTSFRGSSESRDEAYAQLVRDVEGALRIKGADHDLERSHSR